MKLSVYTNLFVTRSGIGWRPFRLVDDTIHRYPGKRKHFWRYALFQWILRPRIKLLGNYLLIHNHWCPGYYHWITEALPRLMAAADQSTGRTLLLPDHFKHLRRSVEPFFQGPIYWIPEGVNVVVENILIPQNPPYSGVYDRSLLQEMRSRYIQWCKLPPGRHTRLYISRSKAARRKISNEAEGLVWLRNAGFDVIYGESLGFEEQIAAMQGVSCLMSIHGAGLSNMIFLPAGATVIELQMSARAGQPPDVLYRDLAAVLDLRYQVVFAVPTHSQNLKEADITVNWSDLAGLLPLQGSGA
ncbi:MAG TPA: glycosyltransferase family 61 protein [Cyclobacteriaceae bacterium]|nr:glycosyltransferase family 61 protein [Cyclobacteriaceae bacterium]